jgi:putrescine---pyruvate transaminase
MSRPPTFLHSFSRPAAGTEAFIKIAKAEGSIVWDDLGNRYVDALASLWYCQVGHGRTEIVDAVAAQMRVLDTFHTFERFTNPPAEALCDRLAALSPMPHSRVFLTSGGSESVETAIKVARIAHYAAGDTERSVVISRKPSYHGVAYGAMSVTGLPANQEGFGPLLPDIVQVPFDDLAAVDEAIAENPSRVAAIVAEPVIGAGGVLPPPDGYLQGLRDRADKAGAFLIFDEVITGFGRLGHWFGGSRWGVVPDMITFAKGVTSGYLPLGGVLLGRKVTEKLEADPTLVLRHGYTYSGHPASAAAALANLTILEREDLPHRADHIGDRMSAGLRQLVDGDAVKEVRGVAGMWAMAMGEGVSAVDVRDEALAQGVIVRQLGDPTLCVCPPLIITDDEIDEAVDGISKAVAVVAARRG